jgi:hypothetical protein
MGEVQMFKNGRSIKFNADDTVTISKAFQCDKCSTWYDSADGMMHFRDGESILWLCHVCNVGGE